MSLSGLNRRYRGQSSIVFDMDPVDRHITPLTKQKKNAEFAAKIEREGFPERHAKPTYYGIGSGQRPVKKAVDGNRTAHSQLGGGFRCDVVGFEGEYEDQFPGRNLRWEHINDDFLGEHRSTMAPYKPKFRPVEGYSIPETANRSLTPSGKGRSDVLGVHKSKVIFAAPGDSFYHEYTEEPAPLTSNFEVPQGPKGQYARELAADVASEFSHPTPKSAFYEWEHPNFTSLQSRTDSAARHSHTSPNQQADVASPSHHYSEYQLGRSNNSNTPSRAHQAAAEVSYAGGSPQHDSFYSPQARRHPMESEAEARTPRPRATLAENPASQSPAVSSVQRHRAQSATPLRTHRKMVTNPNDHDTNRVLHTYLQDEPAPFRSCVRTGIAPVPELEKDPKTLPKERLSDIFNYRYTGR